MSHNKQATIILGMHRSGTSLIASVVHGLGKSFGNTLQPPNDENPKGFFENLEMVRLNDEILQSMDVAWDSLGFIWTVDFSEERFEPFITKAAELLTKEFSGAQDIALKDPRLCILMPFWRIVLEKLGYAVNYIVVIRNPLECAHSQARRYKKDPDFHIIGKYPQQILLLWFAYMRKALMSLGENPSMVISFEILISQPKSGVRKIAEFLQSGVTEEEIAALSNKLVLRNLKRNFATLEELHQAEPEGSFVSQLFSVLQALEKNQGALDSDQINSLLDSTADMTPMLPLYLKQTEHLHSMAYYTGISLRHRLISTIHQISDLRSEVLEKKAQMKILNQHILDANEQLKVAKEQTKACEVRYTDITNSRIWRWTSVLRKIIK